MPLNRNSLFYKIYRLSLPELWLDLFLPILLGAAVSLNISSKFNILYFFITAAAFIIFTTAANSWLKYFFALNNERENNIDLYQFVYYFYFDSYRRDKQKKEPTFKKNNLLLTAIISTLLLTLFSFFSLQINDHLIILILISILLFLIYIFLQIKIVDSYFDELIIGLLSGPFLTVISYMVQSGDFNISVIIISIPISLLIINLRWVSQHNNLYSLKGFKIFLLLIYGSFAIIFSIFNNVIYLFLFISFPIVLYKLNKNQVKLYQSSNFDIINFSRKLYYYTAVLMSALFVLDYIIRI